MVVHEGNDVVVVVEEDVVVVVGLYMILEDQSRTKSITFLQLIVSVQNCPSINQNFN